MPFQLPPVVVPSAMVEAVGGHPLVAEILARRGILDPAAAEAFLDPDRYIPADPACLPDLAAAADLIRQTIHRGDRIGVWGDFDVDGQTSTALLVSALRALGADVVYYIPHRLTESHGIGIPSLDRMLGQGVRLLLTCDTGSTAHEAIAFARERGVQVVVTDHHDLDDTLPSAGALVNPVRLPAGHPLRGLPGVGVAYMLVRSLLPDPVPFLDLVALGIVADVAQQTGDTRYLLQRGLARLRETDRVGLLAIFETAELNPQTLTAESIGFALGPRLNALGRLGDANLAVELFTTSDWSRARILAAELEGLNDRRQLMTAQIYAAIQDHIARDPRLLDPPVLVFENPHWHAGVIGPVAARLSQQYKRPVILLVTPPGQVARGSARSVPGCDINAALAQSARWLVQFGGHPGAAGLAVQPENIPALRQALAQAASAWTRQEPATGLAADEQVDACVELPDLDVDLARELERLAPFGPGNPPVRLLCRNLAVAGHRRLGRSGEHRQVTVRSAAEGDWALTRTLVWWQGGDRELPGGVFDLICHLRTSDYTGRPGAQIEWVEAHPLPVEAGQEAPAQPRIEILDWRGYPDATARLRDLLARGNVQVWGEAVSITGVRVAGRHSLEPAPTLVVWTPPPGPAELAAALARVSPRTLAVCAQGDPPDSLDAFLRRLGGLLKHDLNRRQGKVYLPALAAACGHRLATVRRGIEWFAACGQIAIEGWDGDDVAITSGGQSAAGRPDLEADLRALLAETAAYRAYFRQIDVALLLEGIET